VGLRDLADQRHEPRACGSSAPRSAAPRRPPPVARPCLRACAPVCRHQVSLSFHAKLLPCRPQTALPQTSNQWPRRPHCAKKAHRMPVPYIQTIDSSKIRSNLDRRRQSGPRPMQTTRAAITRSPAGNRRRSADLRVQVLTLAGGQSVPWHYHSAITDSFVCLEGPMVVETRAPRNTYRLEPGPALRGAAQDRALRAWRDGGACSSSSSRASGSTISFRSAEGANRPLPAAPDARRRVGAVTDPERGDDVLGERARRRAQLDKSAAPGGFLLNSQESPRVEATNSKERDPPVFRRRFLGEVQRRVCRQLRVAVLAVGEDEGRHAIRHHPQHGDIGRPIDLYRHRDRFADTGSFGRHGRPRRRSLDRPRSIGRADLHIGDDLLGVAQPLSCRR